MRKFLGVFGFVSAVFSAAAAQAACKGLDLIAALPGPERAALESRADSAPFARGNLWTARRGAQVLHLAGTYHLPDPRHDETLALLLPVLGDLRRLLVEATPEEEARLKAEVARRPGFMVITDGPLLSEQLSEAEWAKLAHEAELRGIPPVMAARLRPWYMAVMLGMAPCAAEELREGERGLDHLLMAEAERRALPLEALEPYDTLFSIFGKLSADDETAMVRAGLATAERPEDMTVTLANAYFAGQSRLIWEFSRDQMAAQPGLDPHEAARQFALMEEVLVSERNRRWLPVLLRAAESGPALAAFGALHLPGEEGVLRLLEREGFVITPLAP